MKYPKYIVGLFFCCITLLFAGCGQTDDPKAELPEPSFETGEPHSNALAFRLWFETMSSTSGPCTVSIQDKIYDGEQAAEWWYAVQSDLNTLNQALGLEEDAYTPFTIFVVENTLHGIQVWNNWLYCTPEDILSGAYREGLVGAALTHEPWKQAGLASSVFGAEEADMEQITAYLENAEDLDILSLFAAYFVEDFTTEEEISIVQGLSQLLCEHVIAEHGGAMLVEDACLDCRQELLDELDVDRTYTDLYGDFDSGYRYDSNSEYSMVVTTTKGDIFYLLPLPEDLETPMDVRRFLYEACVGPQVILETLKTAAPKYAERIAQNYSAAITIYVDLSHQGSSWTDAGSSTISLGRSTHIVHEITHILVPLVGIEKWKYEGCCEYFLYTYCSPYQEKQSEYNWFMQRLNSDHPAEGGDADEYASNQAYVETYLAHAAFPETAEEFDIMLSYKAQLRSTYLSGSDHYGRSVLDQYQTPGTSVVGPRGGNELSYVEAAVFVDYLVENYSLSTFLDYCFDVDATFEGTFGVDYETAKAAWVEDLMSM